MTGGIRQVLVLVAWVVGGVLPAAPAAPPPGPDLDWGQLERLVEEHPQTALDQLAAIPLDQLSFEDRPRVWTIQAVALYWLGDFPAARRLAGQAHLASLLHHQPFVRGRSLYVLASLDWRQAQYDRALESINRAMTLFRELGDEYQLAFAEFRASTIHLELGNYPDGLKYSQLGLERFQRLGVPIMESRGLSNRAVLHYRMDDFPNMLLFANQALELSQRLGERRLIRYPMTNAGVALLELGRCEEALRLLEQVPALNQETGDMPNQAVVLKFIARAQRCLGRPAAALRTAREALQLARRIDFHFEIRNIQDEIAHIKAALGDPAGAYEALRERVRITDEVFNSELNRRLEGIQTRYEVERRQREIELLQKEGEIRELEIARQLQLRNLYLVLTFSLLLVVALVAGGYALQVRANRRIATQHRQLAAVERLVRSFNREIHLQDLVSTVFHSALEHFPQATRGGFLLRHSDRQLFLPVCAHGYSSDDTSRFAITRQQAIDRYTNPAGRVAEGVYLHRGLPPLPSDSGDGAPRVLLALEVVLEGDLEGFLILESDRDPRAFDGFDLASLGLIREHVVSALTKAQVIAQLETQKARAEQACRDLERLARELEEISKTDPLTGLYNRRGILEKIEHELHRFERNRHPLAVAIGDLDNFKGINDTYGHDLGDQVLVAVAGAIRSGLRKIDLTGRWGGEEFLLVLTETDEAGALHAVEKVRRQVEELTIRHEGHDLQVTMTWGLAIYDGSTGLDECLRRADTALYEGKRAGKNCCVPYSRLLPPL